MAGSPADPDRLYASQSSGWFDQQMQRSDDGGRSWQPVDNAFTFRAPAGPHLMYDGSAKDFEFTRVWHLSPAPGDPDVVYAGTQDACSLPSRRRAPLLVVGAIAGG